MQQDPKQLQQFVDASKDKGASDEFLATFLTRRGWPADEVYTALGDYWQRVTGVTLPDPTAAGESSRDAFFYLLSFSTLLTWSASLGSMLFQFINHWLPDAVAPGNSWLPGLRESVTWQMAAIAVAFPVYLVVMRLIFREVEKDPERLQSGVRKWLTWLALLITAGSMICDLIWFLDYFLLGELTMRFVLKASVVFALCGAIFAWYIGSLRWTKLTPAKAIRSRAMAFGGGATLAVVAAFCVGLSVAGTPSKQRGFEADNRRITDLRRLAVSHYNLAQGQSRPLSLPKDPETGQEYQYHAKSGTAYELCATFNNPSPPNTVSFWFHPAGNTCFQLDSAKVAPR